MTSPDPAAVNPDRLVDHLVAAGWSEADRRTGVYARLTWPGDDRRSTVVPLDNTAPESLELMAAVLRELDAAVNLGQRAQVVLDALRRHG